MDTKFREQCNTKVRKDREAVEKIKWMKLLFGNFSFM
jgi:hypothetical protein